MNPEAEALVRSGLKKLGPERCQQSLVAFESTGGGWNDCVLARAYGPPGVLFNEICMLSVWTREAAAQLLGLTLHEINCITDAFDSNGPERLWLENEVRAVAAIQSPRLSYV